MRDLKQDTRGAVYVEFLISFIPVFFMFLGMVQIALMFVGGLAVQRAAAAAARAAAVVLDDDPQYYGGAERMQLGGGGSGGSTEGAVVGFLAGRGISGDSGSVSMPGLDDTSSEGGARMEAIRSAASTPLMAVAPPPAVFVRSESVGGAIGSMPASRIATALLWNRGAMAVRIVDGPASTTARTSFERRDLEDESVMPDQARVRVSYLFHCAVPIANRWICNDPLALVLGAATAGTIRSAQILAGGISLESIQRASATRDLLASREERDSVAWGDFGDSTRTTVGAIGLATEMAGLPSLRVKVMTAEAELPIHFANYTYQSE